MDKTNKHKIEYHDKNGNIVYREDVFGNKEWIDYDRNNRCIRFRNSGGYEARKRYCIYGSYCYSNSNGEEYWYWHTDIKKLRLAVKISLPSEIRELWKSVLSIRIKWI